MLKEQTESYKTIIREHLPQKNVFIAQTTLPPKENVFGRGRGSLMIVL